MSESSSTVHYVADDRNDLSGSLIEFVSCVVLPLRVVTVTLLLT